MKNHWQHIYEEKSFDTLGWYEDYPGPSLDLIHESGLKKGEHIFIAGAGASTLIDQLIIKGFRKISANDLSMNALEQAKKRLGPEQVDLVNWIEDDLTHPTILKNLPPVDFWHDRAVFHFFTASDERESYVELVKALLRKGGNILLAAFNTDGVEKCSGLPVARYNAEFLQEILGSQFKLLRSFDYTHFMPNSERRAYVYTLFHRSQT